MKIHIISLLYFIYHMWGYHSESTLNCCKCASIDKITNNVISGD